MIEVADASGALVSGVLVETASGGVRLEPCRFDAEQASVVPAQRLLDCAEELSCDTGPPCGRCDDEPVEVEAPLCHGRRAEAGVTEHPLPLLADDETIVVSHWIGKRGVDQLDRDRNFRRGKLRRFLQ